MKILTPFALLGLAALLACTTPQIDKELHAILALLVPELRAKADIGDAKAQNHLGECHAEG